jgi:hypothetical protein
MTHVEQTIQDSANELEETARSLYEHAIVTIVGRRRARPNSRQGKPTNVSKLVCRSIIRLATDLL